MLWMALRNVIKCDIWKNCIVLGTNWNVDVYYYLKWCIMQVSSKLQTWTKRHRSLVLIWLALWGSWILMSRRLIVLWGVWRCIRACLRCRGHSHISWSLRGTMTPHPPGHTPRTAVNMCFSQPRRWDGCQADVMWLLWGLSAVSTSNSDAWLGKLKTEKRGLSSYHPSLTNTKSENIKTNKLQQNDYKKFISLILWNDLK